MPETEQAIECIEIDYVCDTCGIGKMRATAGAMWTSDPPQFPHICNNEKCNETQNFIGIKYPATAYRKIGEPKPLKEE